MDWGKLEDGEKASIAAEHKEKGAAKLLPLGTLRMYVCPPLWFTDETRQLIEAIGHKQKYNEWPFPGRWPDQPVWMIEAMNIFEEEHRNYTESKTGK